MCIIAVSPIGEKVSKAVFQTMWQTNDDGFGMFFRVRDGVGIVKGIMDFEEAWEHYANLPDGVPHVLHFRLATHGGVRPELTHPFIVHEDSPIYMRGVIEAPVLAHNGVWSNYSLRAPIQKLNGPVSDSRALAAYIGSLLQEKRSLRDVIELLSGEIAIAGRVVVVDPHEWNLYLVGDWIRDGNLLFSNSSYKSTSYWGASCAYP